MSSEPEIVFEDIPKPKAKAVLISTDHILILAKYMSKERSESDEDLKELQFLDSLGTESYIRVINAIICDEFKLSQQ